GCKFSQTTANKFEIICYLAVFIALNVIVLARGIGNGIEKAASILMPAFFVMLMGMVIFAVTTGDAGKALGFLFAPDFSRVSFATIQAAIGQAFFSLGVGSALMVTYGAYLSRETDIPSASGIVATADTVVALIAGLAIFPIVFAFALDPAGGGGLFFVTMPTAFGSMTGGAIVGGLFFTLALFAAFTSSISLLEVGVSWLEDQPWISRQMGAVLLGLILFGCGVGYVYHDTWIGHIDFVTGTIMLPLGGILVALFAGWVLSRQALDEELGSQAVVKLILPLLRYVIPIALMIFLILGTLDNLQDAYRIDLPEFLFPLIGENPQR
ncbi:MAG: sodium-dependent transporter, partial [Pseudomonadota bacterium]